MSRIKWKTLIMEFTTALAIRTSVVTKLTAIDRNQIKSVRNDEDITVVIKS